MMISPESYYEQFLKGKTAEEIRKIIEDLKYELNRLTNAKKDRYDINREPSNEYSLTREYLDRAINALKEAGGIYIPSDEEQECLSYVENISHINKIKFTSGGYFGGYKTTIFTFIYNKVYVKTIDANAEEGLMNLGQRSAISKEEILDGIKRLHIFEWQRSYYNGHVYDGHQWGLDIIFSNGRKPFISSGSNAYPYNYHDFLVLLGLAR
ncbi:MAG: hypothetical protein LUD27_08910 [Clostridia bacterium]|nr:hypothetical protein [Clostridia bacterium]